MTMVMMWCLFSKTMHLELDKSNTVTKTSFLTLFFVYIIKK